MIDGSTRLRTRWLLSAMALLAVVVVLQARLVGSSFDNPWRSADDGLPAALEPLLHGPAPSAALPTAVAVRGPLVPPDGPLRGGNTGDSPGATPGAGSPGGVDETPSPTVLLAAWASGLGPVVGVPPVALAAYGAAQLEVATTDPGCQLSWPTLAGIGSVESDHGRYAGAVLGANGLSTPSIIGVALDGAPGVATIRDTDGGRLDGDAVLDRAVGAMQFIPSTWARWAADGDGDGVRDPFDIEDAALSAGHYLCAAGGDLSTGIGWTRAIYAYNASDSYVIEVRARADAYARASR